MRLFIIFLFLILSKFAFAQVTGGDGIMQFLNLPTNAHTTAMGGICVSNPSNDAALGLSNPALLRPAFNNTLCLSQNFYYANTNITNVQYVKYSQKYKTTFSGAITFLNYGNFNYTNNLGNVLETRNASEYALQLSASRNYLNKWRYGATLKLANSNLLNNKSTAIVSDFGLLYMDTAKQFYAGAVVKNIGGQIGKYNKTTGSEALPFDMQIGISKKFLKAPFRLNLIGHHLYQWDIRYNNPADISGNSFFGIDSSALNKKYVGDKILRHFNFGVDFVLGKHIEANLGYSHLRRKELALAENQRMAGFSFGLGINLNKLQIHYGRSLYHLSGAYNEISINVNMKKMFGLGSQLAADRIWY